MAERLHLLIAGRVQGVGFRWHARVAAAEAGCTGWVRNLPDGRVEVLAEGEPAQLEALAEACREGPRAGLVNSIDVTNRPATGEFAGFGINY